MKKFIDAHVHVFETLQGFSGKGELRPIGNGKARWATGEIVNMIPRELGSTNFTIETCRQLLHSNHVEKAVLLQGSFYGFQNEYVVESAAKYPDMFLAAGTFDPFAKKTEDIYNRLTDNLKVKVLKFETSTGCGIMSYHTDFDVEKVFSPIAEQALRHGQTLVFDIGSPGMSSFQPEKIRTIAMRYPSLKIVVCHLLAPRLHDLDTLTASLKLLKFDNVFFDIAAVPANTQPETYPYPTGVKFIKTACTITGYRQLLWGTDVPSVLCNDSYTHLADYLEISDQFSDTELEAIYYTNALSAYPFSDRQVTA